MPAVSQGMNRLHANLLADQAWCRMNLGQSQAALIDAQAAESLIDITGQFDDRAPAHSRLAQTFAALGDSESSSRQAELAAAAWKGHEALQKYTLELLGGLPEAEVIARKLPLEEKLR